MRETCNIPGVSRRTVLFAAAGAAPLLALTGGQAQAKIARRLRSIIRLRRRTTTSATAAISSSPPIAARQSTATSRRLAGALCGSRRPPPEATRPESRVDGAPRKLTPRTTGSNPATYRDAALRRGSLRREGNRRELPKRGRKPMKSWACANSCGPQKSRPPATAIVGADPNSHARTWRDASAHLGCYRRALCQAPTMRALYATLRFPRHQCGAREAFFLSA
jgi:hypothetical protein